GRLRQAMDELSIMRKEREKMKELMDSFVQENDDLKLLLKREREEYSKWRTDIEDELKGFKDGANNNDNKLLCTAALNTTDEASSYVLEDATQPPSPPQKDTEALQPTGGGGDTTKSARKQKKHRDSWM